MKRGIILINAYAKADSELNGARRMKEELESLGVQVEVKRNFITSGVISGCLEGYLDADFCIYFDKDKYSGEILEQTGMRIFNRPHAIADCDDKMRTLIALHGFPMPDTLSGPLCYLPEEPLKDGLCEEVVRRLGLPVIVKECFGSLGKGVYKADTMCQLREIAEQVKCKPHLFQKFIAQSVGRDVRVIVIGGKVYASMLRTSTNDFRSNVELGGKGEAFCLDSEGMRLCEHVAKQLDLDYCGIDLLLADEGYLICEVNSNAFFGGIELVTGKNVAQAYASHIMREVYGKNG